MDLDCVSYDDDETPAVYPFTVRLCRLLPVQRLRAMCAGRQRAAVLQRPRTAPLRQALLVVKAGTALHLPHSKAFFRTVSHASHQWLSPTAAALVEALLVARVASLPALREQWQQQPRWLLPQILPWCVASHTLATSVIRVPSSCFCVSAVRCALDRPHQRRYSKLHRDIIKRAWPPALDARAPVQVHCNLRDFLVEILRVQVICSYLRG